MGTTESQLLKNVENLNSMKVVKLKVHDKTRKDSNRINILKDL